LISRERYFQNRVMSAWLSSGKRRALASHLLPANFQKKIPYDKGMQVIRIEPIGSMANISTQKNPGENHGDH